MAFPDAQYVTFDNILLAAAAEESPRAFLKRFDGQVILDEVHYVPALLRALKEEIDADRAKLGRWLLTGSQRFELMKGVSESLAGRIAIIHLETLSSQELRSVGLPAKGDEDLVLIRGGYPELWKNDDIDSSAWFEDYMRTYIERDLKDIVNVRSLVDFRRFLAILAARAGDLLNYSDLGQACGVSNNTIKSWIAALEISGLAYVLPPYFSNIEKRFVKTPKLYFADTGLLCALLGITTLGQLGASAYAGAVWENYVAGELIKTKGAIPGRDFFFFRDHAGTEIDFVLDKPDGVTLIEAKRSERIRPERLSFGAGHKLFHGRTIRSFVAAPTGEALPLTMNGYALFDPRYQALS
jgi:predicted AAA+ superfamily ATPase